MPKVLKLTFVFIILFEISGFLPKASALEGFRELKSEHFVINYRDSVSYSYAFKVKDTAETFYRVITQEFNLVRDELWLWDNRAKIFIASDKEDYLNNFSCSPWSSACVDYTRKLVYTYPNQERFKPVLAHELTHIIFREYIRRNEFPLWLDEGIAVYIEDKYRDYIYRNSFTFLKNTIKEGAYIGFSDLNQVTLSDLNNREPAYAKIFYLEAYSIINFILQEYGKSNFSRFLWRLRKGCDVKTALSKTYYYLKSMEDLEQRWKKFYGD